MFDLSFATKTQVSRKICTTFHNGFMFLATSLLNIYKNSRVLVDRHRHHKIRIGVLWVQTGHSTGTCTATLCVIELRTHQKIESFNKKKFRSDDIRIRICQLLPKTPEIVRIYFQRNGIRASLSPWQGPKVGTLAGSPDLSESGYGHG